MKKSLILISIIFLLFLCISAVSAEDNDTLSVSNDTFEAIQTTVDIANESSVIQLEGTYYGSGSPIKITKAITIEGTDKGAQLDAKSTSQIFKITADNVVLKNLVFTNGNPNTLSGQDFGGAINNDADNLQIINCSFTKNVARYGGAVYSTGSNVSIASCQFTSNSVDYTGAAIELDGDSNHVSDCNFISNVGGHAGGDVAWVGADGILENCQFNFSNNKAKASQFGGAVVWMGANGQLLNSRFNNYYSKVYGSAVYWKGVNGSLSYNIFLNTNFTYWGNPDYANNNYWGVNINSSDEFIAKGLIYFDGDYKSAQRWVNIEITDESIDFASNDGDKLEGYLPNYRYNETVEIINNTFKFKKETSLACSNLLTYCLYDGKYLKVTLTDVKGAKLASKYVYINVNGKTLKGKTNSNGVASIKISLKNAKKYPVEVLFNGDDDYKNSSKNVVVTVKKQKPTLTIQTKTLKAKSKTKTVKVAFKNQFKKAISKAVVKITINKKTYSAKTNSKGIATFKVSLKVKKTYKITAKFLGNAFYNKATKTGSIKLK